MTTAANIHCDKHTAPKLDVYMNGTFNWIEITTGENEFTLFFADRTQLIKFIDHAREKLDYAAAAVTFSNAAA